MIIEVQLNTIGQARFYTKHIKLLRTSNYTIKTCHNNIMMVDTCCKSIIRDCGSNLYVGMRVIDRPNRLNHSLVLLVYKKYIPKLRPYTLPLVS